MTSRTKSLAPFFWLLPLLLVWALLAGQHFAPKTASGQNSGLETASGGFALWKAAPRPGFGPVAENLAAGEPVGANSAGLVESEAAALRRIGANNRSEAYWADLRQSYQQAKGQIDFAHIEADINFSRAASKQVIGGHFSTSPLVEIVPGTESVGANGTMWAKVNLRAPDGNFYPKTNNGGYSSLTPDSWTLAQAKGEMSRAFLARTPAPTGAGYVGTSSGVDFRFFNNPAPLWRGYPVYSP